MNHQHLPLKGLSEDGVKAFTTQSVIERMAASGGNPHLLEQIINRLPSDPTSLWKTAFDGLTEIQQRILDVISIVDRPCTVVQVKRIGSFEEDIRHDVDNLVSRGVLVRDLSDARPNYRFKRTRDCHSWRESVEPERRQACHMVVAERLAASFEAEPQIIARHFIAAGAIAEAVP